MGLFDIFKKKETEKEQTAEIKENELTKAAELYNEEPSDINFITLLAVLKKSETWVPLMETEYGALPYILESEDGTQYYPLFSEERQIPKEYAESLDWACLPFEASAKFVMESVEVSNMLLNAFSKSVVIPEESVRVVMKENAAEHAVDSAGLKLFAAEGAEAETLKNKAYEFFGGREDVSKAYFAKLLNGAEMSYVFVVDVNGNAQEMFEALFKSLGDTELSMPVDYTVYPSLQQQLEEIGCAPFFER